ncbi:MAG: heat-inducible transcriptional repressor HrcA [Acutalibacteraceae bacterium]|jgi:heat-inducible transcriptional repressor
MELGERKQRILAVIIDEYIRTGEPVGSKAVVQRLDQAVSSATVRNEMAELAAMGYLEQPHTSAGRIPTAPAFRLYIDRLMPRQPLSEPTRQNIDHLLDAVSGDPDRLIEGASQALAQITGCAAVSTAPRDRRAVVRRIQLIPMEGRFVALLLATTVSLRTRVCHTPFRLEPETVERIAGALNDRFLYQPIEAVTLAPVQGLLLELGEDGLSAAPLLTAFLELAQEASAADVQLSGQLNLLQHPDYELNRARSLLHFLAQPELVAGMLTAYPGGLRVVLGNESDRPELTGSSIIITRYALGDDLSGAIGLIGPLRMDYAAAIPRLEYFANRVGRLLTELLDE